MTTSDWHEISGTMYLGSKEHQACGATTVAHLGFGPDGQVIPCGLLDRHVGPHRYSIQWEDSTESTWEWK